MAMEKKIYIKLITEVIVLYGEAMILAASPLDKVASMPSWEGHVPTACREWEIVNAQAEAYFTHGRSASGGGK